MHYEVMLYSTIFSQKKNVIQYYPIVQVQSSMENFANKLHGKIMN